MCWDGRQLCTRFFLTSGVAKLPVGYDPRCKNMLNIILSEILGGITGATGCAHDSMHASRKTHFSVIGNMIARETVRLPSCSGPFRIAQSSPVLTSLHGRRDICMVSPFV
ncbi:unnamed protein product [Tuber aestivum]|uniref:Uncharacterized protein n=1 Tax=Tuber aestivum TaxID=59557 RepID=A0A292PQS2_9PEZI|nr:unnamed protein product [Tuber aestivum]